MPYFSKTEEVPYKCPGCKGWFYPSNTSCCVLHSPGSCCHKYESPAEPPREERQKART